MCVETLGHIPRYMDRLSNNNNKMLINNSSCCFAIRVVYTRIMLAWCIRYIYESFFVSIIPSTYLCHKAVNWVCTPGFACVQYYQFLWVFYRFSDVFLV